MNVTKTQCVFNGILTSAFTLRMTHYAVEIIYIYVCVCFCSGYNLHSCLVDFKCCVKIVASYDDINICICYCALIIILQEGKHI